MAHQHSKKDLENRLAHARPLWGKFRCGRVFVTGATGFFAIWLLQSLAFADNSLDSGSKLAGLLCNSNSFCANVPHITQECSIALNHGDVLDFDFLLASLTHTFLTGTFS